jgi:Rne/Rng family ribonuclease
MPSSTTVTQSGSKTNQNKSQQQRSSSRGSKRSTGRPFNRPGGATRRGKPGGRPTVDPNRKPLNTISDEVAAEIKEMNAEDAAAYLKAQLGATAAEARNLYNQVKAKARSQKAEANKKTESNKTSSPPDDQSQSRSRGGRRSRSRSGSRNEQNEQNDRNDRNDQGNQGSRNEQGHRNDQGNRDEQNERDQRNQRNESTKQKDDSAKQTKREPAATKARSRQKDTSAKKTDSSTPSTSSTSRSKTSAASSGTTRGKSESTTAKRSQRKSSPPKTATDDRDQRDKRDEPKETKEPRRRREPARRESKREQDKPIADKESQKEPNKAADSPKHTPQKQQPKIGNGKEMVINAASVDECRIAVLQDRKLEEFFVERSSSVSHVGNIYKGVITNIEASIQAAFVDFGLAKQGFLHISDVQPQYFGGSSSEPEGVGQKTPRRDRPPIQKCFRRGQEVIVQVIKEGLGTKGPTLSTYLSIPGRYIVMMPGMTKLGVSRKIEDEDIRRKMRSVLNELTLPKDMGFILRTAGEGRTKRDLQRDLTYLQRLWKTVVARVKTTGAPAELYRESDLITRTIRDVFGSDFDKLIIDDPDAANRAREFLRIAMPRSPESIVEEYSGRIPMFHHYGIESQIEAIHARQVRLKSGGSIVIDQTEALVAIDVNSGRLRNVADEEETAYKTNIEAVHEIARQLRLRDLGGLVVCDFIDMRYDRHKKAVERELRELLKQHKERARILRMSQFGLIELTRQRQGPSIKGGVYSDCKHCKGSGLVKTPESMTLHVLRNIQKAIFNDNVSRMLITVSVDVAMELQNRKRAVLHQLEVDTGKDIVIRTDPTYSWDQQRYVAEDGHGRLNRLFDDMD